MSETVITTPKQPTIIDRYTHGTTFLSLEHIARMVLSVILPLLVLAGLSAAFNLWSGGATQDNFLLTMIVNPNIQVVMSLAVTVATALLISSGLFWLFNLRVSAEVRRRPDYMKRLVYRVPLYVAFGISSLLVFVAVTDLISIVLTTITAIGITSINVGQLYVTRFLPEAIGLVVISFAAWYQFKLLKGINKGSLFASISLVVGIVLAVALVISVASVLHANTGTNNGTDGGPTTIPPYAQPRTNNLYNSY
ncbi:MAG TPA: hypothetical protein VH144_02750 [Candidatus Saccharimonadales bacterium]|jgi:hypothetical protein|nr:hypothetical protein [Candidatus Saccharimonadales bacterium]